MRRSHGKVRRLHTPAVTIEIVVEYADLSGFCCFLADKFVLKFARYYSQSEHEASTFGITLRQNNALAKPLEAVPLTPFNCLWQGVYLCLHFTWSVTYSFFRATIRGLRQATQRRQKSLFVEAK